MLKLKIGILLLGLFSTQLNALYSSGSDVVDLTPSNFQKVTSADEIWIVEFYAPWCGHCKSLVPEYTKAATALKGIVKVGGVNADEHRSLGSQYGIQGFPTIKIFGANKNKPEDYNGPRTAQGLVDAALKAVKDKVNAKLGGGSKSYSSGGSGGSGSKNDVIELTDANFDQLVLKSDEPWLVEFYAPWCGHCKNLEPHYAKAATEMKGKVKLGALDATVHQAKASQYGIRGYPTIKFFQAGPKKASSAEDYDGGRTGSDIVNWLSTKVVENVPAPEIKQLTSPEIFQSHCAEKPLCVVSVLPHILDCQSQCRNEFLKTLETLGDKYKQKKWGWIWSEAGAQAAVEEALELGGFGYPAMVVLSPKKLKYSVFRGSFSQEGINEFLRDISFGRGSTFPVRGATLPKVATCDAWDGKDGKLEIAEDDESEYEVEITETEEPERHKREL